MLATVRVDPEVAAQYSFRPSELSPNEAAEVEELADSYGATLTLDYSQTIASRRLHAKGSLISCLHIHPVDYTAVLRG